MRFMLVLTLVTFIACFSDAVTWKGYKGKEYALFKEKKNWIDAQRYCTKFGGSLAQPETKDVNNFLISITDKTTWLFIGGNDIYDKTTWEWQFPLKPMRFDYWVPGEREQKSQNCMLYWKSGHGYKWGSYPCQNKLGFLCQREKNLPVTKPGNNSGTKPGNNSKQCIKKCMTICMK